MCGSQHRIDSSTHQRALLKRLMIQPLGAGQGMQVRWRLLLNVAARRLLHLSESFHERWVGVSGRISSGIIGRRQDHAASLLLRGLLQRHLGSIHCVALGHGLCLLQSWILGELRGGPCLSSEESSLVPWLALLERPRLGLPEKPLLLLLLQKLHLYQLLLRCDGVQRGRLHHGPRAPLQHVGQSLLGVGGDEGASRVQPGATWSDRLILKEEAGLLGLTHEVVAPQRGLWVVHHLGGDG